jgi:adenosylmethionine-8-amino-7-oxononanoate aminotransferase
MLVVMVGPELLVQPPTCTGGHVFGLTLHAVQQWDPGLELLIMGSAGGWACRCGAEEPEEMAKHPGGHVFYRRMAHDYPVIERGEGVYLWDAQGRRYLDASGGPLVVKVGHGDEPIAEALTDQASRVAYVHGNLFTTGSLEAYSKLLANKIPLTEPRFYYLSSGSEAIETAMKFVRQVQVARGEDRRDRIISRWGSYHGAT